MSHAELLDRVASTGALVSEPPASTVRSGQPPEWVVEPASLEELVAVVQILHRDGVRWRVDARGRNWGYDDARVRTPGVIVRLARLVRLEIDSELGLATVEPGVTFAMVHAALRAAGARYELPAPGSGPHTSVLGNALDRGLLAGVGERERHCRDFLVLERDGSLVRLDWTGAEDARVRRALPYPPGPHRHGSLFQTGGYGPVVVELTHLLPVTPAHLLRLAVLTGPEPDEEVLRCWRNLLREELVTSSTLASQARRRAKQVTTAHDGALLELRVTAGSAALLRAKAVDVQRLARAHGQRLTANATVASDDLAMIGGDGAHPEAIADLPVGLEWHTAALPFVPELVATFARAFLAEPSLADAPWSLRPLDARALIWLSPFVYRKEDPASVALLTRRTDAFARVRGEFGLPAYRTGGARAGR